MWSLLLRRKTQIMHFKPPPPKPKRNNNKKLMEWWSGWPTRAKKSIKSKTIVMSDFSWSFWLALACLSKRPNPSEMSWHCLSTFSFLFLYSGLFSNWDILVFIAHSEKNVDNVDILELFSAYFCLYFFTYKKLSFSAHQLTAVWKPPRKRKRCKNNCNYCHTKWKLTPVRAAG